MTPAVCGKILETEGCLSGVDWRESSPVGLPQVRGHFVWLSCVTERLRHHIAIGPSVCRSVKRNTARNMSAVVIASGDYQA
jgi:hypothetical protein